MAKKKLTKPTKPTDDELWDAVQSVLYAAQDLGETAGPPRVPQRPGQDGGDLVARAGTTGGRRNSSVKRQRPVPPSTELAVIFTGEVKGSDGEFYHGLV